MRKIAIMPLFLFCVTEIFGQTEPISGVIVDDASSSGISGAIVQIQNTDGRIIKYAITDSNGAFRLNYHPSADRFRLHVQMLGYKTHVQDIAKSNGELIVRLISEPVQIRDVVVKAPDIIQKSDTLVYIVGKYIDAQDRNITDVLKKLPGVEVGSDGQIKYNGEPINKFYIDGSDFLEGRYGLATENIRPEDVKSVEVMENHQAIRALQNLEYSQQAGLNIKLKEEAKHRWVGVANAGVGVSPFLYDASLFTMRIAGNWQSMESIRVNNTGWNPASQNLRHYEDKIFGNDYHQTLWPDYISANKQSAPLDERRTRDNRSYLINTTNTWRISDVYDLKANVTYSGDRLNVANSAFTNYLESDIPSFLQEEYIRSQQHSLNAQLAIQANQPNYYLKDNLSVDVLWNNVGAEILGSRTLSQRAKYPPLKITNDLQLIKRLDNRILSLSSRNLFRNSPQSLSINDGETQVTQDIHSREFRSTTELRYGWLTRKWQIYMRGGVDYGLRDWENNLVGLTLPYPTYADSRYHLFRTYLCPETTYQSKKLLLSLTLPVYYHLYCISDKENNSQLWKSRFFTTPTLFLRHSISAKTEFSAQIRYALTPPALGLMNESVIMNDFRNLQLGTETFKGDTERSAAVSVRYRNPISSLFANVAVKYEWNNYDLMSNQLFLNEYILTTYSRMNSDGKLLQVTGGISKGIRSGKMTFGVDAGYAQLHASSMRQDAVVPYIMRKYSVIPKIKGTLFKWWTLDYMMIYSYNSLNLKNADASSSDMLRQHLTFTFIPNSKVQIYIGAEHYFTQLNGTASNLVLADAGAKWIVSNKVELSVSAANLLNDREYRYADFGSLSETYYTYRIRPRSIVLSAQIRF